MNLSAWSIVARIVFSIALLALAASLAWFAWVAKHVVDSIPSVLTEVESVAKTVDQVVSEVSHVNTQIPEILQRVDAVNAQVPEVLKRVDDINAHIPPILQETSAIRASVPPILTEVAAVRTAIPPILEESESIRDTIAPILHEAEAYRAEIPKVLDESKAVRTMVPDTLTRVENIVSDADQVGKNASEAAVQGFFTGIIKTPFKLAQDLGTAVFKNSGLVSSDRKVIVEHIDEMVSHEEIGETRRWKNHTTGHAGTITFLSSDNKNDRPCNNFSMTVDHMNRPAYDFSLCQNSKGEWELVAPN